MKVRINDMARAAGVSKDTVYSIGLLIDLSRQNDYLNPFFYDIIGGIESVIGPLNYELTINNIQSLGAEGSIKRLVLNNKVDGLIMDNSILTKELAKRLNELSFPFVSIGGISGVRNMVEVDIDDRTGGEMVMNHLLEEGCNRVAFIGGEWNEPLWMKRINGLEAALKTRGYSLQDGFVKVCYPNEANGYILMEELLTQEVHRPDGVICMNNAIAFGALKALKDYRVSIPNEMRIATFDNYPLAPYTTPALTAVHLQPFELGVAAGEMVMDRMNKPDNQQRQRWIVPELFIRESTVSRRNK